MRQNLRHGIIGVRRLVILTVGILGVTAWAAAGEPITKDNVTRIRWLQTLPNQGRTAFGLAFSAEGRYFASSTLDGAVQLWECSTWQIVREFTSPDRAAWSLRFSPDTAWLASGGGTVWDIDSGRTLFSLPHGHLAALSPDGAWMVAVDDGRQTVELWRTADRRLEREFSAGAMTNRVAVSPDGRLIALALQTLGPVGITDLAVGVSRAESGEQVWNLQGHTDIVHGLAFSPDGRLVGAASMDRAVRLWDVETGRLVRTLAAGGELYDIAFSPDGSLVAVATVSRAVELWSVEDGLRLRVLPHGGEVASVAFSPDGAILASGAYDALIYLWGVTP